jgi:hypothetical protein
MIKKLKDGLFSDYLMPSRLKEYQNLLETSLRLGYEYLSVVDFFNKLESGKISKGGRYFIHRYGIDTDVRTAKKMFSIEKSLGIKATYYSPISPFQALSDSDRNSIICMTSHPAMGDNWLVNTVDNIGRLIEGMRW